MWEKVYRDCLAALGGDLQIDTLIIVLILTLVFFSGYAHVVFEDADRRHLESRILHKDATEPEVRRGQGPSESVLALQPPLLTEQTRERDKLIDNDEFRGPVPLSVGRERGETSTTLDGIDALVQEFILSEHESEGAEYRAEDSRYDRPDSPRALDQRDQLAPNGGKRIIGEAAGGLRPFPSPSALQAAGGAQYLLSETTTSLDGVNRSFWPLQDTNRKADLKVIGKVGLEAFEERISRNGVIVALYRSGGFRKRCLKLDTVKKVLYWKDDRNLFRVRKRHWPISDVVSISYLGAVQQDALVKGKWNILRGNQLHVASVEDSKGGCSIVSDALYRDTLSDTSPRGSFAQGGGGSESAATPKHCLALRLRSHKNPAKGKVYQIFMESRAEADWFYSHFYSLVLRETGRVVAAQGSNTSIIVGGDSASVKDSEDDDDNFSVDTYNTLATTSTGGEGFHLPLSSNLGGERTPSYVRPQASTFKSTLYR
jgi:hypothetical protein